MRSISNNEAFLKLLNATAPGQQKQTTTVVILGVTAVIAIIVSISYYHKYKKTLGYNDLLQIQIKKLAGKIPPNEIINNNTSEPPLS